MLTFLMIALLGAAVGLDPLESLGVVHLVWAGGLLFTSTSTTRPGTRH